MSKVFFPKQALFLHVCSARLLKTLWKKEKLLVTSNFSFSNSVFYSLVELSALFIQFEIVVCKLFQFGRVQNLSFGKGLYGKTQDEICQQTRRVLIFILQEVEVEKKTPVQSSKSSKVAEQKPSDIASNVKNRSVENTASPKKVPQIGNN